MDVDEKDSPLSVTANIAGILTFLVAIVAAVYARLTYLRNSDQEYFRVKTSLSWYKTESTWLAELVRASAPVPPAFEARTSSSVARRRAFEKSRAKHSDTESAETQYEDRHDDEEQTKPVQWHQSHSAQGDQGRRAQYEMYKFVMDDLINLEQRLLDLVEDTELRAARDGISASGERKSWTLVPTSWRFTTSVALAWLPVRSKALELVRQRDALTARVSFTQMSMISS